MKKDNLGSSRYWYEEGCGEPTGMLQRRIEKDPNNKHINSTNLRDWTRQVDITINVVDGLTENTHQIKQT